MRPLLAAALAVGALALVSCGDDNSGNSSTDTVGTQALPPVSPEQAQKLKDSNPAPPKTAEQKKRRVPSGDPQSQDTFSPGAEQQAYESANFFCKTAGVTGLSREYNIESTNPEDIAQEAARRTYSRKDAKAVYSGCLAGLREADK